MNLKEYLIEAVARRTTGKYSKLDIENMSFREMVTYLERRRDIIQILDADADMIIDAMDRYNRKLAMKEINRVCRENGLSNNCTMWFSYDGSDGPKWIYIILHINDTTGLLYRVAWDDDSGFNRPKKVEHDMLPYGTHWTADRSVGQELDELLSDIEEILGT